MSRFVKPLVVRLPLSKGDFIDVKKRLNVGEKRAMFARMTPHLVPGENVNLDTEQVGISKVLEYLVGWSLMDDEKPVPMSADMPIEQRRATLNNLDSETFTEMLSAIETHEDAMDAEREAEKNGQGGGSTSSAISPSLTPMAGATSGSTS